jgi:hypothetical protein
MRSWTVGDLLVIAQSAECSANANATCNLIGNNRALFRAGPIGPALRERSPNDADLSKALEVERQRTDRLPRCRSAKNRYGVMDFVEAK